MSSFQVLLIFLAETSFFLNILCIATNWSENGSHKSFNISTTVYPTARRDDSIYDDYYGLKVADPYRWMEDPNAPETRRFVNELNAISGPFFAAAPARRRIRAKLNELFDYEKFSCPAKHGKFYYYSYNKGSQNQK
ncbi:unnamed protein product [Strongylus vulgaris]|uniref:Peptidase S9A N-terminal domain-containing protein n=1 Tax=Strongylus vulgaris TaxID=40348 RepID=A0A3P7KXJ8_STRVU|nr:unnamed protein product [Strongylus vulgaris]